MLRPSAKVLAPDLARKRSTRLSSAKLLFAATVIGITIVLTLGPLAVFSSALNFKKTAQGADLDRQGKIARIRSGRGRRAHRSPAEPPRGGSSVPALVEFTIPEIINCGARENPECEP